MPKPEIPRPVTNIDAGVQSPPSAPGGFAPPPPKPEEKEEGGGILSSIANVALSAAQAKFAAPSNSPPMSSFEKPGGISGRK